jgi:hypothetical protein
MIDASVACAEIDVCLQTVVCFLETPAIGQMTVKLCHRIAWICRRRPRHRPRHRSYRSPIVGAGIVKYRPCVWWIRSVCCPYGVMTSSGTTSDDKQDPSPRSGLHPVTPPPRGISSSRRIWTTKSTTLSTYLVDI